MITQHGQFMMRLSLMGVAVWAAAAAAAPGELPAVREVSNHQLGYAPDESGNQIPDFSHCGYAGANREISDVPVVVTVAPGDGDDGARIQAAIDHVASMPQGNDGFRGAVRLASGEFQIAGQLRIAASGIVLRGAGAGEGGTRLVATGVDRRTLLRIVGASAGSAARPAIRVLDDYVPVGARTLRLESVAGLGVGGTVVVTRPSTAEWIRALGGHAFGIGWRPGSRDIRWDRVIVAIDGDRVTLDAPITTAVENRYGGATVTPYDRSDRIDQVGVEDLRMESQPTTDRPLDEDHAWHGVTMENVENAWVRRVEFRGFAGGAVALWESTKWITVEDCLALAPVSEIGGYRRHTFFTQGQLTLFLRCWSEHGRHDFAAGHGAAGPNAFVNCRAAEALGDSGPLESWASGVLYDNVRIDGAGLALKNRWIDPPGTGWSAANCVLWQCRAATIECFRPPTANNWAIGCWGQLSGDGTFEARSDFVRPMSLYQAQLRARIGEDAAKRVEPILGRPVSATNPTVAEAARFVADSNRPGRELVDAIRARLAEHTQPLQADSERSPEAKGSNQPGSARARPLTLQNGWLVAGDTVVSGGRLEQPFWRGTIRPGEAAALGPALTRFVPGRVGLGFTDDLDQLADGMKERGVAVFDHHYGLWYDRRRDDHTMGRQADGNVAPPFYEQPFARTGDTARGTAWDGLSKYDLTRFNPWYWNRLREFARHCDRRGLVLLHQHYFQHNILEAGAHWADSPWRAANNVNDTGLPEPPPYIGDKRIFMAENFYDVTNPKLRELHRGYIRQCLGALADQSNVIHATSAEYSGPLAFTQFWLDTIADWQRETGRDVLVALSAPKDVQDAILADPERAPHVDIIDIRYWCYTADSGLYAPRGGQNLAPRQHLRQTRAKPGGAAAIVKAVREYRERFPEKAVIYNAAENCPSIDDGWAVFIAGGSLAGVRLPPELAAVATSLNVARDAVRGDSHWALAGERGDIVVYGDDPGQPIQLAPQFATKRYHVRWIDPGSGNVRAESDAHSDQPLLPPAKGHVLWLSP